MTKRSVVVLVAGAWALLTLAPWSGSSPAGAQGVTVGFSPGSLTVAPGTEFEVELRVTLAGSRFNGFQAVVSYDPAALTVVPLSPLSLQLGSLVTDACGSTFHRFRQGTGTDTLSDALLCAGVFLSGPGPIYRLRLRAAETPQATTIRIVPGTLKFYEDGLFVSPVQSTDAAVGIGMPPAAAGDAPVPGAPSLTVAPNPGRGRVVFTIGSGGTQAESLTVRDVQGRAVWKSVARGRSIAWDAMPDGRPVPSGTYFATLEVGGRSTTIRFSVIR